MPKPDRNRERDLDNQEKLRQMNWRYLVIWECEVQDEDALRAKIAGFMS